MPAAGSIVVRRQLGRELRTWRERAQRSRDDVAAAQVASVAKLARIEHGLTSIRPGDVRELCLLYGVCDDTTEALADLARATRTDEWWEGLGPNTPRSFAMYLGLEAVASQIDTFHPTLVTGLFQTRDYALAVERGFEPDAPTATINEFVAVRMERQRQVFGRPDSLRIRAVIGEPALTCAVGSADVMAAQLTEIRRRAAHVQVQVRVLPQSAGAHPGMHGGFSVLDFADPADPAVAYVQTYDGSRYPETPTQVARYRRRFEEIWAKTITVEEYVA